MGGGGGGALRDPFCVLRSLKKVGARSSQVRSVAKTFYTVKKKVGDISVPSRDGDGNVANHYYGVVL